MYAPPGFGWPEVGDVEVFPDGERLHLFHLTLPNHDAVRHAVSDDGLAWRPLPDALRTSDPGACDDDMIWTMSVTAHAGRYYMLYTAIGSADNGRVQRTALAVSDDLVHWTKSERNPVGEADPRWYESDPDQPTYRHMISWRDPKPIKVGETYYATVNARENSGPTIRRGCAGLLVSDDMETWEVRPPLFAPRRYWDLECPQVFTVGGTYYLTAGIMEDRTQRYWVADAVMGPYRTPPSGGVLAPQGHYAGRVCRWRDEDLYCCWHKAEYDFPGIAAVRNPAGKFVVAPLALVKRPDGSLARRSFSGWRAYRVKATAPPTVASHSLMWGRATNGAYTVDAADGVADIAASADEYEHFLLEGTLHLDAASGGLGFRLDGEGGGYFVEVTVGSTAVSLQRWLPAGEPVSWFRYDVLQRGNLHAPAIPGTPLPFALLVVGPYIEVTLGDEVLLCTLSAARTRGPVGIWAQSGTARTTDVRLTPMRVPRHG